MSRSTLRILLPILALAALYFWGSRAYPDPTHRLVSIAFVVLACAFGLFYVATLVREGGRVRPSLHLLALFVAALLLQLGFGSAIAPPFSTPILVLTIVTGVWCYLFYSIES